MSSSRCKQSGCSRSALSGKEYCLDHHKAQDEYNYGLDYEIQKKMESKWDSDKAKNCQQWIEAVTKKRFSGDFHSSLKSGVLLCELINGLFPGTIRSISQSAMPFNQRENIAAYLNACKSAGLRETDLFVTQDLFEGDNLVVVVDNICALGVLVSKSSKYKGAQLTISGGAVQTSASPNFSKASSKSSITGGNATKLWDDTPKTTSSSTQSSSSSGGTKFCGECGSTRKGDAKFCGDCGNAY